MFCYQQSTILRIEKRKQRGPSSERLSLREGPNVKRFVVAVSQKEAEELVCLIGHERRSDAERHLAEIKAPPTDPYYANQYKIWTVQRAEDRTNG